MTALDSKLVKFLIWLIVFFSGFAASFAGYLVAIRFQDIKDLDSVKAKHEAIIKEQEQLIREDIYINTILNEHESRIDILEATIDEKKTSLNPSHYDEKN